MKQIEHLSEEDLILIYYGESGVPDDARTHLGGCEQCKAAADSLAQTLNLCDEWTVPEPDAAFEHRIWAPRPRVWIMPSRAWIGIAASIVVLAAAFLAGRASKTPAPQPAILAGLSDRARERILEISLADHLDRAGIVLTEVSNSGDIAGQRTRAEDLVEEGRLLRQTLARRGDSATLAFLDDIQRVLIELANSDPAVSPELLQYIGDSSLVFKARVMESNLRSQGQKL